MGVPALFRCGRTCCSTPAVPLKADERIHGRPADGSRRSTRRSYSPSSRMRPRRSRSKAVSGFKPVLIDEVLTSTLR